MFKRMLTIVTIMMLAISVSATAQEKKEMKAEKKEMKAYDPVKVISCGPECGFTIKSRDEKEITDIINQHGKRVHNLTMSEENIKGMMKTEKVSENKKEVEKKMEMIKEVHKH